MGERSFFKKKRSQKKLVFVISCYTYCDVYYTFITHLSAYNLYYVSSLPFSLSLLSLSLSLLCMLFEYSKEECY